MDARTAHMQPGDAGVAVCLTGELRWHALTLASFQQLVLARLRSPHRLYFAGPAGEHHGAALRVLGRLGAQPPDICAYNPEITWAWGPGSMGMKVRASTAKGTVAAQAWAVVVATNARLVVHLE